jgi:hypothetical protein
MSASHASYVAKKVSTSPHGSLLVRRDITRISLVVHSTRKHTLPAGMQGGAKARIPSAISAPPG